LTASSGSVIFSSLLVLYSANLYEMRIRNTSIRKVKWEVDQALDRSGILPR